MTACEREALYYPFHLCHSVTLVRLLDCYARVHFRDYMALRLTPLSGTTAVADRMGDYHPEVLQAGRIVQGYPVSGSVDPDLAAAIDRDLADRLWRDAFHDAFRTDRRFQAGLFDPSHGMLIGGSLVPGPAALLRLLEDGRRAHVVSVAGLRRFHNRVSADEAYEHEYALALVKTAAALGYTVRLCLAHGLEAATDSEPHFRLLERTRTREELLLPNRWFPREGY